MRRNSKSKILIVLLLIFTLVGGMAISSYAVTQDEKDQAEAEAQEAKEATEAKRKEAKEAAKKAAAATANLEEAEAKLEQLEGEIEAKRAEIAETKAKMKKKQEEIEEQNDALDKRLTAMYKTGTASIIDVVLNSEDVTDLLTNVGMVHKILESDQELLRKLQKDYKELKKLKAELEDQEIALEAKQVETEELRKRYKAEADEWHKKEEQLEAEAKELAAEAAAKQEAAERMIVEQGGEIAVNVGEFAFPVNSNWKITSKYGWRICPFHGREFHNGVDLVLTSGTYGSPIYAIADGVITRASWYGGYGNCIQLACGGGISVLYGHLKGYNCSKDQFVKKGTIIGYVGSTGNSTGPHLHFTVFKDGNGINPMSLY